ncbi:hypothetical protein SHIRM173S_10753 [Streptomyces hirsutus]
MIGVPAPRDTYKGQPNGLRKDLAEKIAALKPGFVRFPGGCLVNTGSMEGYSEGLRPGSEQPYQWKDTVGPVEERATNANFWGYNQSYGLGYYEYFRFAEDVGAMPLTIQCPPWSPDAARTGPPTTRNCWSATSRTPST